MKKLPIILSFKITQNRSQKGIKGFFWGDNSRITLKSDITFLFPT